MVAVSSWCNLLLFLLVSLVSPLLSARNPLQHSRIVTNEVDRLIRGFNLSPQRDINIISDDNNRELVPSQVENPFVFPHLIGGETADDGNGTSIEDFGHHAGYFALNYTQGARMFYLFFESRNKNKSAPLVVWITGGPGCSGSLALFTENGPFQIDEGGSLKWNEFGWDQESNLIYVDQPMGTGFSYSTSRKDIRNTSDESAVDFYNFLQAFFAKHPEYGKNDFYITGESYAGHYIPAYATEIQKQNKNKDGNPINLKGVAIGNGLTKPEIQYKANLDFALDAKLITKDQQDNLNVGASECASDAKHCAKDRESLSCRNAGYLTCNGAFNELISYIGGNINYYDIRKKCVGELCYDFSSVEQFLNGDSVRKVLGVGDIKWVSCSTTVAEAMAYDLLIDYSVDIPPLLQEGVRVLIYAGEYDLICNWLGNSRWLDALEWSGQKKYLAAHSTEFVVGNEKHGLTKSEGPLTFLKVYNAGHLVPMDQPKASLEMLKRWMNGIPL